MQVQTRFVVLFIILVGLLGFGCKTEDIGPPIIVTTVATDFQLDLFEEITPDGRQLKLMLASIAAQECEEAYIEYTLTEEDDYAKLVLEDIVNPPNCTPSVGPAKADVNIDLSDNESLAVRFWLKQILANYGDLSVDQHQYYLTLDSDNGFDLLNSSLHRLPEAALWGQVVWTNSDDQSIANQFLVALGALTNSPGLEDGYYGYFNLSNEGETVALTPYALDRSIATLQQTTFALERTASPSDIQTLVATYRAQYPDALSIYLQDGTGQVY